GPVGTILLSLNLTASASRPTNDNFANRTSLVGGSVGAIGSNVGAASEPGEPLHAGKLGGRSVWWTWTAPSSGFVTVSTSGSSFDTLLGVYTGDPVNSLSVVASNDDDPNGGTSSKATFNAIAGTAYQIAVDGYQGASGNINMNVALIATSSVSYFTRFETSEGYNSGFTLAGQNGWT